MKVSSSIWRVNCQVIISILHLPSVHHTTVKYAKIIKKEWKLEQVITAKRSFWGVCLYRIIIWTKSMDKKSWNIFDIIGFFFFNFNIVCFLFIDKKLSFRLFRKSSIFLKFWLGLFFFSSWALYNVYFHNSYKEFRHWIS